MEQNYYHSRRRWSPPQPPPPSWSAVMKILLVCSLPTVVWSFSLTTTSTYSVIHSNMATLSFTSQPYASQQRCYSRLRRRMAHSSIQDIININDDDDSMERCCRPEENGQVVAATRRSWTVSNTRGSSIPRRDLLHQSASSLLFLATATAAAFPPQPAFALAATDTTDSSTGTSSNGGGTTMPSSSSSSSSDSSSSRSLIAGQPVQNRSIKGLASKIRKVGFVMVRMFVLLRLFALSCFCKSCRDRPPLLSCRRQV
jgi:hypothetical protein